MCVADAGTNFCNSVHRTDAGKYASLITAGKNEDKGFEISLSVKTVRNQISKI